MADTPRISTFVGTSPFLMARVRGNRGEPVHRDELASITCKSFSKSTAQEVFDSKPNVRSIVFNEMQRDSRWTSDDIGYNIGYQLPVDAIPSGSESYRIEMAFFPTNGSKFFSVWEIDVEPLYSTSPEAFDTAIDGLTTKQREAYLVISKDGPVLGKSIARRINVELSTLRKHILPALRPLGLKNDRNSEGYYI